MSKYSEWKVLLFIGALVVDSAASDRMNAPMINTNFRTNILKENNCTSSYDCFQIKLSSYKNISIYEHKCLFLGNVEW